MYATSKIFQRSKIKNILSGAGRITQIIPPKRDIRGLYLYHYKSAETPKEAIQRDWEKVGNALKNNMSKLAECDAQKKTK